ncbi:hypothetical protein WICPIJ_001808 [Wickerhamomyces pijperi]|uniref:Uncharacterized protein n=1 Tax=Wickerhamomyces pijperi TaxID=599730 RepID=A0A9P8TPI9_WICPI|nr:hypothetical protein WICPIJ_001808 [Wickerhamomyces pijperi]
MGLSDYLSSIKSETVANKSRIFQFAIGVIILAISGTLTANQSSLSSLVKELNTATTSNIVTTTTSAATTTTSLAALSDSTSSLSFKKLLSSNALSLATSSLTLASHTILSYLPSMLSTGSDSGAGQTSARLMSTVRAPYSFASAFATTAETTYATSVGTSEAVHFSLWLATFSTQLSKYGTWDCSNATQLYSQYGVTSGSSSDSLTDSLGLTTTTGEVNALTAEYQSEVNTLINELFNLTGQALTFSQWNTTALDTKDQLIIKMAQDCLLKKANIGVSFLGFLLFLASGTTVLTSAIKLSNLASNNQISERDLEKAEDEHNLREHQKQESTEESEGTIEGKIPRRVDSYQDDIPLDDELKRKCKQGVLGRNARLSYSRAIIFPTLVRESAANNSP